MSLAAEGTTPKEAAMEVEDDVFFADLNKQISLLIMDDDEDHPIARCPSVSLQTFTRACHPIVPSPIFHDQVCKGESKGTGVFIPRSSQPRRKNRQGKSSSSNKSSNRQSNRSRSVNSNLISNDQSCNFYSSKNYEGEVLRS